MSIPYCGDYCAKNADHVDKTCKGLDYPPGAKILFQVDGKKCYCICGELGADTPVATPEGWMRARDVAAHETVVLAAGRDLDFKPVRVTHAAPAGPGAAEHAVYLKYLVDGQARALVVAREHPFLLHGGTLAAADALRAGDALTGRDGAPAPVLEAGWSGYTGDFHPFATVMEPPAPGLDGHLVLTNGVVTGDFAVQVFSEYERASSRVPAGAA